MKARIVSALSLAAAGLVAQDAGNAQAAPQPAALQQVHTGESSSAADRCQRLANTVIGGARIESVRFASKENVSLTSGLKAPVSYCQLRARIVPVPGSEIKLAIVLPENWNGKLVGLGGGGFNGGLTTSALGMARLAADGFISVATDAGHDLAELNDWAIGNPQKVVDFGHRANHLGAVVGKAAAVAFYSAPVRKAYFSGCSNGGRDALMMAQRYPNEFDAIAAGAPANNWTGLMSWFGRHEQVARLSPGIDVLGPKLGLLHDAVMAKCDGLDGLKDGLIERPNACRFKPAVLACKGSDTTQCLSPSELSALKELYGSVRLRNGNEVLPGLPLGSEYEWKSWLTSPKSAGSDFVRQFYRYMVFEDRNWDPNSFNIDRDYPFALRKVGPVLDAVDPDLRPFLSRGGKLLMYHGWDDAAIPAGNSLNYFASMQKAVGRRAQDQTRLFMMPGVAHCLGGHGPSVVDWVKELDSWVDSDVAPNRIVATKHDSVLKYLMGMPTKTVSTRPLCAWPKVAHYKGGAVDDAASYECQVASGRLN